MFSRSAWMTLLSAGPTPVLNLGSSGEDVRRVQRALNAASAKYELPISGTLDAATQAAVHRLAGQERHRGERRGRPGFLGRAAGGQPLGDVWPLRGIAAPAGKRLTTGRRTGVRRPASGERQASRAASEVKKPSPSVPAPVSASVACSGCGISPTTLPRSLVMPAMSRSEPLGLSSR